MLYQNTRLIPEIETEIKRICDELPEQDLAVLMQTEAVLKSGGFRAQKPAALRQRLLLTVLGSELISDTLRRALGNRMPGHHFLKCLSYNFINKHRNDLIAFFGKSTFLTALLLDSREPVRKLGSTLLNPEKPLLVVDRAVAAENLKEQLGTITDMLGVSSDIGTDFSGLDWQAERDRLKEDGRKLRVECRRLKGIEKQLTRVSEQLHGEQTKVKDLTGKLESANTDVKKLHNNCNELRQQLEREVNHRNGLVHAAVEIRIAEEYAGWLAQAQELENKAKAAIQNDISLLDRAEAALKTQAEYDRHSGNLAALHERLEQTENMLLKVHTALANAVRSYPDLQQVSIELSQEVESLKVSLGLNQIETPFESMIAANINTAHINDLPQMGALIEQLLEIKVIERHAGDRLHDLLRRRKAIAQAIGEMPLEPLDNAVGIIKNALSGKASAILLIDGHNILFGLQGRYLAPSGSPIPDANKREKLVADIVHRFKNHPTCRVWIVYDGPDASDASPATNVRLSYSGGQGDNRADGVLLENLKFFVDKDSKIPVVLASNDNALGQKAMRLGAKILSALELGSIL